MQISVLPAVLSISAAAPFHSVQLGGGSPAAQVMKADANREGYVDRAEYQLSGERQFSHLDPDHRGAVPISDLPRLALSSAPQARRLKALLRSADRDHDTTVTRAEFVKARWPVCDRLDQDRNGRLSRKEVEGARSRLEAPR